MFHTIITFAYSIPSIYLLIRFWQFYFDKEKRLTYLFIYAILLSIYPASQLFDEDISGGIGQILETISNYLLPFFLYLFLSVLLIDLLLLLNLSIRVVPREKLKDRSFRNRLLIIILTLPLIVLTLGIINFNTIRTTEYLVEIPAKSSDIASLKIAFVSDFHIEEKTPVGFIKRFVNKIETIKPDLLLYGGDIMEGDKIDEKLERIETILKNIRTKYGVYGVRGNHDRNYQADTSNFYTQSGIFLLNDSVIIIGRSISLAGRKDARNKSRKSAEEILKGTATDLPLILMDHQPTDFEQLASTSADIVLSGHTHHGQLFPINLITNRVYELSYGYMKKENTHFFVSSGIRLWGPPVRTIAKSEILILNITFSDANK